MRTHQDPSHLSESDRQLLSVAEENQQHAYAPYSHFLVGVAILTSAGNIVRGANQENASYPLCMCGERVALYHCAMRHPGEKIETLAIAVRGQQSMPSPAPPCGACLQVMKEYEMRQSGKPIRILLKADGPIVWEVDSVSEMLPFSFDGSFLTQP